MPAPIDDGQRLSAALPRDAIERQLALLPLYIVGGMLTWQLWGLLGPPGRRDGAGLVKGHDFAHFYTLGTVVREGRLESLYDYATLNETMWRVVPETRPDTFQPLYGPQMALAFAPFASLPYERAVHGWLATSLIVYVLAAALLVYLARDLRAERGTLVVLLLLSPALNVLLVSGQTSAVALLAVTGAWWALDRERPVAAGLALGVLAYKPQLLAGALAVVALGTAWRVLAATIVSAAGQLLLTWSWAGTSVMEGYVSAIAGPVRRAGIVVSLPQHLHSLAGFWRLLLHPGWLATTVYILSAALVVVWAARPWRAMASAAERVATLVLAMVLAAPHLYVYDLVLLGPPLAIAWGTGRREAGPRAAWLRRFAWLGWLTPLSGPIALATRIQVSTLVLVPLLAVLTRPPSADTRAEPEASARR